MGPIPISIAFTGVFGFLNGKINHLTGRRKYRERTRMQLIDHGIAQGVIGKGPYGSVVTCINLAFIVRKKRGNGETSLHSMDTHPPIPPPGSMDCAFSFSGTSEMTTSVERTSPLMEAAFCRALRVTLVGLGNRGSLENSQRLLRFLPNNLSQIPPVRFLFHGLGRRGHGKESSHLLDEVFPKRLALSQLPHPLTQE